MALVLTPLKGVSKQDCMASTEGLSELAQQSPSCTQTLEHQTNGGMDEVGHEGLSWPRK